MTKARTKRPAPYTSDTLATSRKMVADGPLHEERAVIRDLMWRRKSLTQALPHYDRKTGKPLAEQAQKLREETQRRIDALPESMRAWLTRENWES